MRRVSSSQYERRHHRHLFLGGALLLLVAAGGPWCPGALGCPARCDCSAQSKSVSCHRRRLPAIPEGVPIETRVLDLSKNRLRAVTPDNFSSFAQLEELDLSDNLIAAVEPGSFRAQLALRSLVLRSNLLQLVPAGVLSGLTNLTHLDLSHNRLVVLLDHGFQDLRRLTSLEVGDNELVFVSQRAFAGLLGLRSLTLERSNLTVVPTDALAHLHGLTELRLRHLSIGPALKPYSFKRLWRLRHLEVLYMDYSDGSSSRSSPTTEDESEVDHWPWLEAVPPLSLHGLNLSALFVTHTNLTTFPGAALQNLPYLTHLNLSYCHITHIHRGELGQLPYLQELRMQGARLASIEPMAFAGLSALRLLDVSGNRLDSLERDVFAAPGGLRRLCLGGNPLVCDCRLLWLLDDRRPPSLEFLDLQPECSAPERLQGKALRDLKEPLVSRYVTCTKPRIGPNTTQLLMAEEGQPARLSCTAEGAPRPSVTWLTPHRRYVTQSPPAAAAAARGGRSSRVEVQADGTLLIKAAELHDGGVYLCIASNAAGNASLSASLAVKSLSVGERSLHSSNRSQQGGRYHPYHPHHADSSSSSSWNGSGWADGNGSGAVLYNMTPTPIDLKTILISTAMGCLSFLGVVVFCFLLLFAWSRGKGRHKGSGFDIEYVPRKAHHGGGHGAGHGEVAETSGPRRVNMKMI